MGQTLTDEAIILYDPIQTIFDVLSVGGDLTQQKELMTGEYEPDRSVAPMELVPTLLVTDPNTGEKGVEKISQCTVTWYKISSGGTKTEIESTDTENDDYALDGKNLHIRANIGVDQVQRLKVEVNFPSSGSGGNLSFEKSFSLTTSAKKSFDPMLTVDAPNLLTVNPFHMDDGETRVITASFFAGPTDISTNPKVVYVWQKMDGTTGNYRNINATDIEVASIPTRSVVVDGVSTTQQYRSMTLRMDCIKQSKFKVTAYYADIRDSQFVQTAYFTVDRKMYGARLQAVVTKGKYLKPDTEESEAEIVLHVNSNKNDTPEKYYRARWNFYKLYGSTRESEQLAGWGMSISVDRSKSGYDRSRKPTFEATVYPLSEYQLLTDDNGDPITDDSGSTQDGYGGYVVGQVLEDL